MHIAQLDKRGIKPILSAIQTRRSSFPRPVVCYLERDSSQAVLAAAVKNMRRLGRPLARTFPRGNHLLLLISMTILYGIILIRTAWLTDDAYITLRVVDNLWHGHGLVWNPGERVQVYTHPLWMMLLALGGSFTKELPLLVLAVSAVTSLIVFGLSTGKLAASADSALLAALGLILSRAFVDYSTSGLETPLSNLLLIGFLIPYLGGDWTGLRIDAMAAFAGLAALNRFDAAILLAPPLGFACWQLPKKALTRTLSIAILPIALWESFSLLYYGFPFPNTALAKLNTGIPAIELSAQGLRYLQDSLQRDPITLPVIVLAIGLSAYYRHPRNVALGAGILCYVLYVVRIGGDFMSGRFLVMPFVAALALIISYDETPRTAKLSLSAIFLLLGLISPRPTIFSGSDYGPVEVEPVIQSGISDERAVYYSATGLLRTEGYYDSLVHPWASDGLELRKQGPQVVTARAVGFLGYFAGPQVHIIDQFAIADPLLARLPSNVDPNWRVGHYDRSIPEGYVESIRSDQNRITSSPLAQFYESLHLIVSGPLWSQARLLEVLRMNMGVYKHLVAEYERSGYMQASVGEIAKQATTGRANSAANEVHVPGGRLLVSFGRVVRFRTLCLGLEDGHEYMVRFERDGQVVFRQSVGSAWRSGSGVGLQIDINSMQFSYDHVSIDSLDGRAFELKWISLSDC